MLGAREIVFKIRVSYNLFHNPLRFVELCSFYFLNTLWNREDL